MVFDEAEFKRRLDTIKSSISLNQAAKELGLARSTVQDFAKRYAEERVAFPPDDLPIEELLAIDAQRFEKRIANIKSKHWFPIAVNEEKPFGAIIFGDPHLDDNYCNTPLLLRHVEIAREDGVYAFNVGDTTNNWQGRMARLWMESDNSQQTAHRKAKWFMHDAGIRWLLWLLGNHDDWGDGGEFYRLIADTKVPILDWRAQFRMVYPTGLETKVDMAHGRRGRSDWNELHSMIRAAKREEQADVYITGHTHNFGIWDCEVPDRGFSAWLVQVRGYKWYDDYGMKLGFASSQRGASAFCVIDPREKEQHERVMFFSNPERGMEYLLSKRNLTHV